MSTAIQGHRQNAGDGRLADAAVTAEDVAMRDPLLLDRVFQGAGDVLLPNHLGKTLRTVFARQNLIAHAELRLYPCREKRFSTGCDLRRVIPTRHRPSLFSCDSRSPQSANHRELREKPCRKGTPYFCLASQPLSQVVSL